MMLRDSRHEPPRPLNIGCAGAFAALSERPTHAADVINIQFTPFSAFYSPLDTNPAVLAETIAVYRKLGNWSPHVEITQPAFEAVVDIFQHAGLIGKRYAYEDVAVSPPSA
jgi:hypothetical protein